MNRVDFSQALIWAGRDAPAAEQRAARVLAEEIEKRTGLSLPVVGEEPAYSPYIYVGCRLPESLKQAADPAASPGSEGYRLVIRGGRVAIAAPSPRGCFYGVGRLLRMMKWGKGVLEFPADFAGSYAPRFPVRGHQLGYRPKTNAYDAWTPEIYQQYIRELVLFGANGVEILPPGTDDEDSGALMKYDQLEMMCQLSEIIHDYGIETWVWYPNMARDYRDAQTAEKEIAQRRRVFGQVPYIDHVFIPGGDPGDLPPEELFEWSEQVARLLHTFHPEAKLWISPQTGTPSREWSEAFYAQVNRQPAWLHGIVFAPWERDSAPELRSRIPRRYPIRNYPDITHMLRSQYPVPQWDMAMALTLGRECTNPRPVGQKNIHNLYQDCFVGSVAYSEGINDDVNKFIWLDQEWDSSTPVIDTLRDYAGLFIDWDRRDEIAQGLLTQEQSLQGPIERNRAIDTAFQQWTALEGQVGSYAQNNYRFEMGLLRAYFDRYQKERCIYEQHLEREAMYCLEACESGEVDKAIAQAEEILRQAESRPFRTAWSDRIEQLADRLFEHIGAQLTVSRHHAAGYERGAYVDALHVPLNDARYIRTCLKAAKALKTQQERAQAVYELVHRTDPGPGGFYDSFESFGGCWERLAGKPSPQEDPAYLKSPLPSFLLQDPFRQTDVPLAWRTNIYTLYQNPLVVSYPGLDRQADYWLRVTYARYHTIDLSLNAVLEDGSLFPVHGPVHIDRHFCTLTLALPRQAYEGGKLVLRFSVKDGQRGPNLSELLLTKRRLTEDGEVKMESC